MRNDYSTPAILMLAVGTLLVGVAGSLSPSRAVTFIQEPARFVAAPVPAGMALGGSVVYPEERVAVFEPLDAGQEALKEPGTEREAASAEDAEGAPLVDPFPPREDRDDAAVAVAVAGVQEQAPSSCPLSAAQGAVVVDFSGEDTRPLRADGSRAEAERTVPVALSEGAYTATIALSRENGDGGRLDRVFLKFYDAAGELVATTSPTRDLTEGETEARERTAFVLPSAASSITVRHLAYAATEPHFLSVSCVLMEPAQRVPGGSEQTGAPQVSADAGELEVYAVSETGEGSARAPEPSLGKGALFSVSEREDPRPDVVPTTNNQTAAVGNTDVMRILLPLTMLALTIVGLLALSLVRPRA